MGLTPFPSELILRLARAYGATVFVETGTFHGATAAWAAQYFQTVHTVEVGAERCLVTAERLSHMTNIAFHMGNSRDVLPKIVDVLGGQRAVYYLDGHWSGEGTDGEADQCPLLDELACLSSGDIIIIDDARIFMGEIDPLLNATQWPSIEKVFKAIPEGMEVRIIGDVIFAVPASLAELLS
jgi:predicted O-methyltransferase YrrM